MAENGGARPGAGRKPKAEKFKLPITKAEKRIADRLPELIDNMMALSDGIYVEEALPGGTRIVYKRPPDRQANEYLINRIMGKPTERKEVTGESGGPIHIQAFDYQSAVVPLASDHDEDAP